MKNNNLEMVKELIRQKRMDSLKTILDSLTHDLNIDSDYIHEKDRLIIELINDYLDYESRQIA